jgi:hypothetical protein
MQDVTAATQFYFRNQKIIDMFDNIVYGIIFPMGFDAVVIVATITTVIRIKQMTSWRRESASQFTSFSAALSACEISLMRMLVGCSTLFIACNVPAITSRLMMLFIPGLVITGGHE